MYIGQNFEKDALSIIIYNRPYARSFMTNALRKVVFKKEVASRLLGEVGG
jgi:hypothetical protein